MAASAPRGYTGYSMQLDRLAETQLDACVKGVPMAAAPLRLSDVGKRGWNLLKGDLPSRTDPPSGCVFRTRCPYAIADCAKVVPPLRAVGAGHGTACIREDIL